MHLPGPGTFRWRDRPFSGALPWRLHPGSVSLLLRWSGTHSFASTPRQLLWLRILEFSDAEQSCFVGQTSLSFGVLLFLSVTEFDLPIPCREFLPPCPWEIFICPFWFLFFSGLDIGVSVASQNALGSVPSLLYGKDDAELTYFSFKCLIEFTGKIIWP